MWRVARLVGLAGLQGPVVGVVGRRVAGTVLTTATRTTASHYSHTHCGVDYYCVNYYYMHYGHSDYGVCLVRGPLCGCGHVEPLRLQQHREATRLLVPREGQHVRPVTRAVARVPTLQWTRAEAVACGAGAVAGMWAEAVERGGGAVQCEQRRWGGGV